MVFFGLVEKKNKTDASKWEQEKKPLEISWNLQCLTIVFDTIPQK